MAAQITGKVPKIRFKAYSEPWAEEKIGDVLAEKRRPISLEDDQRYELITVKRRNEGVVSRGHLIGREILVKNYAQLKGVTSSFPSAKWSTGRPASCRRPWMAPLHRTNI